VVYRGEFDPYGQSLYEWEAPGPTNLNSHKYTGYERDNVTNLDYAKARTYHHNRGRFMQPDPLGLGAADTTNPQSLNLYSYVRNDPVNFTDPTGMNSCWAPDGSSDCDRIWDWGFATNKSAVPSWWGEILAGGSGQGQQLDEEKNEKKPCPPDAKALAEVDNLLAQSGLDQLTRTKEVSDRGKGYILTFSDQESVNKILGDKTTFVGGQAGGSEFHRGELKNNFGPGGTFADFRSLKNGKSPLSENRSLQIDTYTKGGNLLGGYVDTDRYNPKQSLVEKIKRAGKEVVPYLIKRAVWEEMLMRVRWILILIAALSLIGGSMTAESQTDKIDGSVTLANELWEMAIAAKGGRGKLYQVKSLAISHIGGGPVVDFMVFPDKFFRWADTRPSKIGLIVEMFNFEHNIDYTIIGDKSPKVHKNLGLNPELRSRLLRPQLTYLLETRWFKPEILRASKRTIRGKSLDLVDVLVKGYGPPHRFGIFLDEKTHLPVRIGLYSDRKKDDLIVPIDLGEYREVAGIKVPTAFSSEGGSWGWAQVEINADYNPEVFEREPDIKAGQYQWRKTGIVSSPPPNSSKGTSNKLTPEQIAQYIRDLESSDGETVMAAGRELIIAGDQAAPALTEAMKSKSRGLRFFAAATMLEINRENEAAVRTMRDLLLDPMEDPEGRQNAAFRLMRSDQGIDILTGLLKHTDTMVRRCVIFAFDELTELTEIPKQVNKAIPVIRELLKDNDEVVRGMAEEVLEQIEHRPRK